MEKESEKVFVQDIGEAAYLLTLKYELVGLERTKGGRFDFVFSANDGIQNAIGDFVQDRTVNVPIFTLFNNFRLLKNRLYAFK